MFLSDGPKEIFKLWSTKVSDSLQTSEQAVSLHFLEMALTNVLQN